VGTIYLQIFSFFVFAVVGGGALYVVCCCLLGWSDGATSGDDGGVVGVPIGVARKNDKSDFRILCFAIALASGLYFGLVEYCTRSTVV